MQTAIPASLLSSPAIQEAEGILRTCVHCGFCNATCPTYQVLGDELDGPRGRIYLIKQMLEGSAVSGRTLTHLDRCLTCRNCETTCPSGVQYGRLLDVGRELAEQRAGRPVHQRLARWLLCQVIPYRARFSFLLRAARAFRPLLPPALKRKVPARSEPGVRPSRSHKRRMILLEGCVQPGLAPGINAAGARVLDRLGIEAVTLEGESCCGAAWHHTSSVAAGLDAARRNIDALWPHVETGIEAIVSSASGCGVHLKEYGHLLRQDAVYAGKAARVAGLVLDLSEVLAREDLSKLKKSAKPSGRVVFQSSCTLQHGQKLGGIVEKILQDGGIDLVAAPESHLCCGSAGTYSILMPSLSRRLGRRKIAALDSVAPAVIATANIGCLAHLAAMTDTPVVHWIELID